MPDMRPKIHEAPRVFIPLESDFLFDPFLPELDGVQLSSHLALPDGAKVEPLLQRKKAIKERLSEMWAAEIVDPMGRALAVHLKQAVDAFDERLNMWTLAYGRPGGPVKLVSVRKTAGKALDTFKDLDQPTALALKVVSSLTDREAFNILTPDATDRYYAKFAAGMSARGAPHFSRLLMEAWGWRGRFESAIRQDIEAAGMIYAEERAACFKN
ncbi:MAG: hypothetical protein V2B18_21410 [Pseudomonadota bacterium]